MEENNDKIKEVISILEGIRDELRKQTKALFEWQEQDEKYHKKTLKKLDPTGHLG